MIATNVFVKEDGAWRMVHHQSGPTNGKPEADDGPPINGSDAVFAAVAALAWQQRGWAPQWPAG